MNITGVKGLTPGTLAKPLLWRIATFKALGAVENDELRMGGAIVFIVIGKIHTNIFSVLLERVPTNI